jgi:hypothetical protein
MGGWVPYQQVDAFPECLGLDAVGDTLSLGPAVLAEALAKDEPASVLYHGLEVRLQSPDAIQEDEVVGETGGGCKKKRERTISHVMI